MNEPRFRVIEGGGRPLADDDPFVMPPVVRMTYSPDLKRWAEASAFEAFKALRDGDLLNAERLSSATLGALKVLMSKKNRNNI